MRTSKAQTTTVLFLFGVILLATGMRVAHLGWGLPAVEEEAFPSKVAIGMWGFDDGSPNLDPGTAGWPALSFYVQRSLQQAHYLAGRAGGKYSGPMDYYVQWLVDPGEVILLGRGTAVACGLVVCLIALVAGTTLVGRGPALLAGLLCAVSPLLVRHSQLVEPDALVVAFSALALWGCMRVAAAGRTADYVLTGIWIGLGTASKYTPALMALSLYAVHLERRRAEGLSNRYLGLDDRRLGWAALVAFLGFCVASPYTLADLTVLRRDFAYQALHMSSGHFGHAQQGVGYAHYLLRVLPDALGWPALAAGLAGLVWSLRGPALQRVPFWGFLPYILVLGSLSTHFDRYMLPAILPLALGASILVQRLLARLQGPGWVYLAASAALLLFPARSSLDYLRVQGAASTQQLAGEWLKRHLDPERGVLATERYGPDLPRDRREEFRADPAFARMSPEQRQRLLGLPAYQVLTIPMYSVRTDLAAYYYDLRHYLGYDWLVTSGAVRNRYLQEPRRFARQVAFYELLDEVAEPAWTARPAGRVRGPALNIYRVDDAFRARVRERLGALPRDHYLAFTDRMHAPHFLNFVQSVATHAELRGRRADAAFWFEILALTGSGPRTVALGYERAGENYLELRLYDDATRMYQMLERFSDRRLLAWGNLGVIAEEQGSVAEARRYFERVLEVDPGGEAGAWARRRLDRLDSVDQ